MKCGLILEGGARRGIFTAGILDRFLECGVEFPYVVGVSAGAQAAVCYAAGQRERAKFMMLPPKGDDRVPLLPLHDVMTRELRKIIVEYSYDQFPLDFGALFSSPVQCEIVATDCKTGGAVYFSERESEERLLKCLLASCSLPAVFEKVGVDGGEYLDGSIADSVPYERAFEVGCDRAVVILTKPEEEAPTDYRKMRIVLSKMFEQSYPELFLAMMDRYDRYAQCMEKMSRLEKEGKVMVIRPEKTYVKAFDTDLDKLEEAYRIGRAAADSRMSEILSFMKG